MQWQARLHSDQRQPVKLSTNTQSLLRLMVLVEA